MPMQIKFQFIIHTSIVLPRKNFGIYVCIEGGYYASH